MRVTKELKTKVERIFGEKKGEISKKASEEQSAIRAEYAEMILPALESMANSGLEVDQILFRYIKYEAGCYGELDELARKICSRCAVKLPGVDEIEQRCRKDRDAVDKEMEDFLIKVAYAGDLDEIKKVFAEAGLTF